MDSSDDGVDILSQMVLSDWKKVMMSPVLRNFSGQYRGRGWDVLAVPNCAIGWVLQVTHGCVERAEDKILTTRGLPVEDLLEVVLLGIAVVC